MRDEILKSWALDEVKPWRGYTGRAGASRDTVVSFKIQGQNVVGDRKLIAHLPPVFGTRMTQHEAFLRRALARVGSKLALEIWIDLGDEAIDVTQPTFSFQKKKSSRIMLIPDAIVDPPWRPDDNMSFTDKDTVAYFIGSTTGWGSKQLTLDNLESLPRVQAANAFLLSPDVEFRLPAVVQCDDNVRELARHDPRFSGGMLPPEAQLSKKFVISIDGNGATCSRVTSTLWSNSVLLKYKSDQVLFYFKGLIESKHFISISRHQQVIDVVQTERAHPGYYQAIASASAEFAREFLSEDAILTYSGFLMEAFSDAIVAK